MRLVLNLIWLIFAGFWLAILDVLAGLVAFVLIITIPFGIAAFRIASYVLWPFGRTIEPRRDAGIGSLIGNIIWIILLLVAGPRAPSERHRALPDDHRHPPRPRRLQGHPDHAATARSAHRPDGSAFLRHGMEPARQRPGRSRRTR